MEYLEENNMKQLQLFILFIAFGLQAIFAQAPEKLFDEANQAYSDGYFEQAAVLYDSVLMSGYEAVEVYYNLGNAYYRQGELAPAILNYERALKLDPSRKDVQANLAFVNTQVVDQIEEGEDFFVSKWWDGFMRSQAAGQWGLWVIVLLWIALALGGLFLFTQREQLKRISFFGGIGVIAITVLLLFVGFSKKSIEQSIQYGIIFTPNAYIKSAPNNTGTDLFILHEGTKVEITDELEAWFEIELADGQKGWAEKQAIEGI